MAIIEPSIAKYVKITCETNGWVINWTGTVAGTGATEVFTDYASMGSRVNYLLTTPPPTEPTKTIFGKFVERD
jgi:hypothetical protein